MEKPFIFPIDGELGTNNGKGHPMEITPKNHDKYPQSRNFNQLLIKKGKENKFKEFLTSKNRLDSIVGQWPMTRSSKKHFFGLKWSS